MSSIRLTQSKQALRWRNVMWTELGPNDLFLLPGQAWHDDTGVVRLMSLSTPDGGNMNLKLFPRNEATDLLLRVSEEWLVDLGLEIVGNAIYSGDRLIVNLALELGKQFTGLSIRDYLRGVRMSNLGYFDLLTGAEWFEGSLSV